jgi:flagellar hook assembly protein FlgD
MEGKIIRRICSRQGTRPEQLDPMGSTFTWDGRLNNGEYAPEGMYHIVVKAYVGEERYEAVSDPVMLLGVSG